MLDTNPRAAIGGNAPPALEAILKDRYADLFKRTKTALGRLQKADLKPQTEEDCATLNKLVADAQAITKEAAETHQKEKEPFLRDGKTVDGVFNRDCRDVLKGPLQAVSDAAATRLLAITRLRQKEAAEAAEAAEREAQRKANEAAKAEAKGNTHTADLRTNQAEAAQEHADSLSAFANRDESQASKTSLGGITMSAKGKLVCTGVNKAELDWAQLSAFIKEEALIEAVNRFLALGNQTLKGAVIVERAIGSVRR